MPTECVPGARIGPPRCGCRFTLVSFAARLLRVAVLLLFLSRGGRGGRPGDGGTSMNEPLRGG